MIDKVVVDALLFSCAANLGSFVLFILFGILRNKGNFMIHDTPSSIIFTLNTVTKCVKISKPIASIECLCLFVVDHHKYPLLFIGEYINQLSTDTTPAFVWLFIFVSKNSQKDSLPQDYKKIEKRKEQNAHNIPSNPPY